MLVTHQEASLNILKAVEEGTLVQGKWHGRSYADGREVACLLGSIHQSVSQPADCNGKLMPLWLAELTPTLFDRLSPSDVYPIAMRYGKLVGEWHKLSDQQWASILNRFLIRAVGARAAAYAAYAYAACDAARDACDAARDAAGAGAYAAGAGAAYAAAAYAARAEAARLFTLAMDLIEGELTAAS